MKDTEIVKRIEQIYTIKLTYGYEAMELELMQWKKDLNSIIASRRRTSRNPVDEDFNVPPTELC